MKRAGENFKGKMRQLESTLKKERGVHRAMLATCEDETVWDMEETRYRTYLYQFKQKVQHGEILAHTRSIQTLKAIPLSLDSFC